MLVFLAGGRENRRWNQRKARTDGRHRKRGLLRFTTRPRDKEAITSGDKDAAQAAFKAAMPEFHRGVTKGVFHRNTVARKLSRLNKSIRALS